MRENFEVFPVGIVKKADQRVSLEIFSEYKEALLGLEQFSHIIVFCWFHKNDTPERRKVLRVHPRRNKTNPLTGVFATRSPSRPNLISCTVSRILDIHGEVIHIDDIDVMDGTPILDIKPYLPRKDIPSGVKVARWTGK